MLAGTIGGPVRHWNRDDNCGIWEKDGRFTKPSSAFISFRGGTEILTNALSEQLTGNLRLNTAVTKVYKDKGAWLIELDDGQTFSADAVILTTPAFITAKLLASTAPATANSLNHLRSVSSGTITFAFRRNKVQHPLDGFGVVIPRREERPINAMTWASTKFAHRAPDDHLLIRVFFGGVRSPQMMDKSDDEIRDVACRELAELMGITAKPVLQRVYRWHQAQPQYDVGHLVRVSQIEESLPEGLFVAGCFYRGVGIPDCVRQGKDVAKKAYNSTH